MKTYLVVTNDEFEHPVKEVVGSRKVAELFNIKVNTLSKYMLIGFPRKHKYKAVVIEDMQYYDSPEKVKERKFLYYKRWTMKNDRTEYWRERWRKKQNMQT